jgi:hypothetical protein
MKKVNLESLIWSETKDDPSEYQGEHRPPGPDGDAPLYDVTLNGVYPSDFYDSHRNMMMYHYEMEGGSTVLGTLKTCYKKPNCKVKIYRAIPDFDHEKKTKISQYNKLLSYHSNMRFFPVGAAIVGALRDELSAKYPNDSYDEVDLRIVDELSRRVSLLEKEIKKQSINNGDWVTIDRKYAVEHGLGLRTNYTILTKTVPAKTLYTNGDSLYEWGYWSNVS